MNLIASKRMFQDRFAQFVLNVHKTASDPAADKRDDDSLLGPRTDRMIGAEHRPVDIRADKLDGRHTVTTEKQQGFA